ncbi:sigma-70 [Aureococcus anophagefferens]|nr:sigma-70 [Aureococcus anophagefferens]
MDDLDADEKRVISLRYGLEDGVPCTPAQVAASCAESKEWVAAADARHPQAPQAPLHRPRPRNEQREALGGLPPA